ncbi:hypothetical protein SSX86_018085 [Deinandra increscens subsp. villosa]|uniref:BHLH domain-containing protein n=1 Tax=Deinandra increscens subsp. villosa TaxID=3103831 RepID=A0AAP0CUX5_9ASTR
MSSFLQSFLNNPATKEKYGQPSQISTDFLDSDQRFSDLSSFYSTEANQVKFSPENGVAGFDLGCQRRRSRINEKLKALQTLVPNSNKTDKASMLDEAIEYLKQLQLKVQSKFVLISPVTRLPYIQICDGSLSGKNNNDEEDLGEVPDVYEYNTKYFLRDDVELGCEDYDSSLRI